MYSIDGWKRRIKERIRTGTFVGWVQAKDAGQNRGKATENETISRAYFTGIGDFVPQIAIGAHFIRFKFDKINI